MTSNLQKVFPIMCADCVQATVENPPVSLEKSL